MNDKWQRAWRPAIMLVACGFFSVITLVISYLLVAEKATISDTTAVLGMMIGFFTSVGTVYTLKRSEEKKISMEIENQKTIRREDRADVA